MVAPLKPWAGGGSPFGLAQMIDNVDPSDLSASYNGMRVVRVLTVDLKDFNDLLPAKILGYARRGNKGLNRNLPLRDPLFRNCFASEITSIKGLSYVGSSPEGTLQYTRYQLVVVFSSLDWDCLSDGQVATEDQRFVDYVPVPRCDMIALDGGSFVINDPAAGALNGQPVLAKVGIRLPKLLWRYKWVQVPRNYILDNAGFPTNLMNAMGTVNSDTFRDMVAGTLLCDACELIPTLSPAPAGAVNGANADAFAQSTVPRTYTAVVQMLYWSPATTSTTKGHNLYPARDRNFYNITTQIGNNQQYTTSVFANIWKPA